MRKRIAFFLGVLLCAILSMGQIPARAEECFVVNVDSLDMNSLRDNDYIAEHLSGSAPGIRVQKYISNSDELAARVRVTLVQMDTQTVVFDKNYGYQSGTFDSGEIYLPFEDSHTVPYLVTLYVEDWVYAMPFMQLLPRFTDNGASTYGVRMRDYDPSLTSDWLMGTMLDLSTLRSQGGTSIPLCASNAYVVGQANVALQGDTLSVTLWFAPEANVELRDCKIFCVKQVGALTTAEPRHMGQPSYAQGEGIDVSGVDSVLLYVPMLLSYDPAGLQGFGYDLAADGWLQWQLALWNQNMMGVSQPETEPEPEWQEPEPVEEWTDPAIEEQGPMATEEWPTEWVEEDQIWD